jgi:flagellar biosynthesis protein FlhG
VPAIVSFASGTGGGRQEHDRQHHGAVAGAPWLLVGGADLHVLYGELDIGAGTNYHALDFFLWADVPVVISTPDGARSGARRRASSTRCARALQVCLVLNAAAPHDRAALGRVRSVIQRFLGSDVVLLGQVPSDPAVSLSARRFLPVVEGGPECPAARAMAAACDALAARLPAPLSRLS